MKTSTLNRRLPIYDPVHLIGSIEAAAVDGVFAVHCDGRIWHARRAASCLLAPAVGDTVLISGPDRERVYLIAVIEQADPSRHRIEVDGDLTLATRSGAIAFDSAQDLHLKSAAALRLESETLALRADQADCVVDGMRYTGREVTATVGKTRLIGKVYEAVVDRLVQMSRNVFRTTDEVEHVRAGNLDYQAEQSARVHARYTMVTGDDLVKVDAKQIHMG
ncbi:MAG: DUF3540 domain-containing protein [Achromobacter sp.]|mgnify:CR=1 FL=1